MGGNINKEISGYILDLIYKDNLWFNNKMSMLNISYDTSNISREVRNKYKNTDIYNIEIVHDPDETIMKNLKLLYEEKFFDYIILNDVIETLVDPWKILSDIKKYLKDDGYVITNIPNLMNGNVIKSIISGVFTYTDEGILNKRNLRFFTLIEIQKLFDENRYNLNSILSVKTNDMNDIEDLINSLCTLSNINFKDQFLTYNYIVKASIKKNKTLSDYVLNK